MIFVAVLTTITTGIMSVIHTIILGIFFLLTYIYFGIVKFIDFSFNHIKQISTSCPSCQRKYALATYECLCGAQHTKLMPSRYGIMKRKCECGRTLATSFLNGRHKLPGKWICPHCGYELNSDGFQVDLCIPVVGGMSTGKTCFINMAINEIEQKAPQNGLNFEYLHNDQLGDVYEENKSIMDKGYLPDKTHDLTLHYYQFYLTPNAAKVRNLISLCDVAGEVYDDGVSMGQQVGFRYASAFLMIVDPLSVEQYIKSLGSGIDLTAYRASDKSMDEVLSQLVTVLQNMYSISAKDMLKTDVVVVFNKCDIPGLNDIIGPNAVQTYMAQSGMKNKYDAQNVVCENFLRYYEEENFLNNLKSKFKSVQFFACSSLGHNEDGTTFTPQGVYEPVLWIIDKVSSSINLKQLWGKQI
jgi:GTPase SAR1 family protein